MTSPEAPPRAGRVPAWSLWTLRVVVLVAAVMVFLQPVTAGRFVTGDVGMLRTHSSVAGFLVVVVFFQFVAALLLWRSGRGASWPIWASVLFFVIVEAQSALGYARVVGWHIPLGVLTFGFALVLVIATWSPKLWVRRSAPRRPSTGASAAGGSTEGGPAASQDKVQP